MSVDLERNQPSQCGWFLAMYWGRSDTVPVPDRSTVYRLSNGSRLIQDDDGMLIINTGKGSWARLSSEAGRYCSDALGVSVGTVCDRLAAEHGSEAVSDMLNTFERLREMKLLEEYVQPAGIREAVMGRIREKCCDDYGDDEIQADHGDGSVDPQCAGQGIRPFRPKKIHFVVSESCNLRCRTCYRDFCHEEADNWHARSSAEWVATIKPAEVVVTGGEPTLREDLLDLISIVSVPGTRVVLATNGTRIDRRLAKRLAKLGCDVQVSIESPDPERHDSIRGLGSHAAAVKGVQNLVSAGVPNVELVPTVGLLNTYDTEAIWEFSSSLGVKCHISLFQPVGAGAASPIKVDSGHRFAFSMVEYMEACWRRAGAPEIVGLDEVGFVVPRDRCGAGSAVLAVSASRLVYPCHLLMDSHLPLTIDKAKRLLEEQGVFSPWPLPDVDLMPQCRRCTVRYFCGGGCRAAALSTSGRINCPDPRCNGYRVFFQSILWSWDDECSAEENFAKAKDRIRCDLEPSLYYL